MPFTDNSLTRQFSFIEGSDAAKIMLQTTISVISNAQCSEKNGVNVASTSLCAYSGSDGISCEKVRQQTHVVIKFFLVLK